MIEDAPTVFPNYLDNVLQRNFFDRKGKLFVKINDDAFEFNANFRLYFITKVQTAHYLPDVFIKLQIIDFAVSREGLQEKLLADVLGFELPEDEKIRRELITSIADDRLLLKKGEERILDLLTNSRGMILDDIELIESLKISKEIARAVSEKIVISEQKQKELSKGLIKYEPVAQRGVNIFFTIQQLIRIDTMYQFSLSYFSTLFKNVISGCKADEDRI